MGQSARNMEKQWANFSFMGQLAHGPPQNQTLSDGGGRTVPQPHGGRKGVKVNIKAMEALGYEAALAGIWFLLGSVG